MFTMEKFYHKNLNAVYFISFDNNASHSNDNKFKSVEISTQFLQVIVVTFTINKFQIVIEQNDRIFDIFEYFFIIKRRKWIFYYASFHILYVYWMYVSEYIY